MDKRTQLGSWVRYPKEILNIRLILGGKWDGNSDGSDILDGIGGASIGSEALKALAEGFQNRKGNAIVTIGEGKYINTFSGPEYSKNCRAKNS